MSVGGASQSKPTSQRPYNDVYMQQARAAASQFGSSAQSNNSYHSNGNDQSAVAKNTNPIPSLFKNGTTGNAQADSDIAAFYKIRDEMLGKNTKKAVL